MCVSFSAQKRPSRWSQRLMVGKAKAPTAAEKARMDVSKHHIPCLCCLLSRAGTRLPTIHHITSGFKRKGHHATLSLCEWHHQGYPFGNLTNQEMSGLLGPSLAHSKRQFNLEYGGERILLEVQNFLLNCFQDSPWLDYDVSPLVKSQAIEFWIKRSRN